ncbi:MAG: hypothetical protein HYW14_02515, partial [Planctomycetes bacterium]|nr:hypothetical protein [Planctomycetota bacterium]
EFIFCSSLKLTESAGREAKNLEELLEGIREVDGSVIFNHTHHFLLQHQYWVPEPPSDFAHWVTNVLQEGTLGEQLASINTVEFHSIRELREQIIRVIESHIKQTKYSRSAPEGMEFQFIRANSVIFPTGHKAKNLLEFYEAIQKVSLNSIYHHVFEARLRLEKGANDFSQWLENSLGEKKLASQMEQLDPYFHTIGDLRDSIAKLVKQRLESNPTVPSPLAGEGVG